MMVRILFPSILPIQNMHFFELISRLVLCLILFNVPLTTSDNSSPINVNKNQLEDWWIQSSVPTALLSSSISGKCVKHSQEYLIALRKRVPWAVKMYESSGRLVQDLIYIEGSENDHHESGLFDECLLVESDEFRFQGQYCTVFFKLQAVEDAGDNVNDFYGNEDKENVYNHQKPSVSYCLPSTCTASDLYSALVHHLGYRGIKDKNFSVVPVSEESYCYTKEKIEASSKFDSITITILSLFCLLAVIVTTATLHETLTDSRVVTQNSFAIQLLHCFSAEKNFKILFSSDDSKDILSCVQGIRVLSTCWIVLIHVGAVLQGTKTIYNRQMTSKNAMQWEVQWIANGLVTVDTFFLIGGLLVTFNQLRQLDQNKGIFNLKRFYIRRYIRLTPVYATVLAVLATIWPQVETRKNVRKYWWAHMLYINNYIRHPRTSSPNWSFGESWYLACDMQMFWISPLFIYPIWRWKRSGLIWTAICLFFFLGVSATVFIVYDLIPAVLLVRKSDIPKIDPYFDKHYLDTSARIPPYLIGILLGWVLYKSKNCEIHINKFLVAAGWITAILLALSVIYGMFPYLDENLVPVINPLIRISYGALHRSAWAIAVGWIIFACTHGYGGFINRFLSWKLFIPLSRLSYAVYLIHLNFALFFGAEMRKPVYVTELFVITTYLGILAIAFLLASVVSVSVEIPFLNLDKLLFRNNSEAPEKKKIK